MGAQDYGWNCAQQRDIRDESAIVLLHCGLAGPLRLKYTTCGRRPLVKGFRPSQTRRISFHRLPHKDGVCFGTRFACLY
jgi:hypothetical protein